MIGQAAISRSRIAEAAVACIEEGGLGALTVSAVAERASVSSALVHYHFATKDRLIAAAASSIARARAESLAAALEIPGGLPTLDALWRSIESRAGSGAERAWCELVLRAGADAVIAKEMAAPASLRARTLAARLPSVLASLGTTLPLGAEELAASVAAQLDGCSLALVSGEKPEIVRAAYDAFWLALIAAGQSAARR